MRSDQVDGYVRDRILVPRFENPAHRESLLPELIDAATKGARITARSASGTRLNGPSSDPRRWPGRRRALLATVGLVGIAGLVVFAVIAPGAAPSDALAQSVDAIRNSKSMRCEISRSGLLSLWGKQPKMTLSWVAPDLIRLDQEGETTWVRGNRITRWKQGETKPEIAVDVPHLTREFHETIKLLSTPNRLIEVYSAASEEGIEVVRGFRGGRVLFRLQVRISADDESSQTMYIDPETLLPVEIEYNGFVSKFTWGPAIDPGFMVAKLPAGAEPPQVIDGSKRTPVHLVEAGKGVGPIRFGMTLEEVESAWGKPARVVRRSVGGVSVDYPAHGVRLTISPQTGVDEIAGVLGDRMKRFFKTFAGLTPEHLGIGSTEADIVAALGEPDSRSSRGRHVSGQPLNVTIAYDHGISFQLAPGYFEDSPELRVVGIQVGRKS